MAPFAAGCFGSIIFSLIRLSVHVRRNPVPWAVYTSPVWFLIAGTVCCLSIVYKGSPKLGLSKKPPHWIAGVTLGTGGACALLAAIFFVPYVRAVCIKRDGSIQWWEFVKGPLLWNREPEIGSEPAVVPNYAVVQEDEDVETPAHANHQLPKHTPTGSELEGLENEKGYPVAAPRGNSVPLDEVDYTYEQRMAMGEEKMHAKMRQVKGPFGWAMRLLHENPMGKGMYLMNIVPVVRD